MALIKLTNSRLLFRIDDEDIEISLGKIWRISTKGYAATVVKTGNKSELVYFHRLVMGLTSRDGKIIDHINRDKLDNRKANLRVCSFKENARNRGRRKNSKYPYKGIEKCSRTSSLYACLVKEGVRYRSGPQKSVEDAAREYDKLALKHFGEFAFTNFK